VLVVGETGAGKELVPSAIARFSPRLSGRVEVFNCPAVPVDHLESELFGTVRGAYPGAVDRTGAAERARGGVLFLDEIGAMDLCHQAKILRLLESGEARRLGATKPHYSDAVIAAATNQDLRELAAGGGFREDLYYRLVQDAVIVVPPLRERGEDVLLLAEHFLAQLDLDRCLTPEAVAVLREYDWPGNVRQLRAVVRSSARLSSAREIGCDETLEALRRIGAPRASDSWARVDGQPTSLFYSAPLEERRRLLVGTLKECCGNRTAAGLQLGLHLTRYGSSAPSVGARKLAYRKFCYWWSRLVENQGDREADGSDGRALVLGPRSVDL